MLWNQFWRAKGRYINKWCRLVSLSHSRSINKHDVAQKSEQSFLPYWVREGSTQERHKSASNKTLNFIFKMSSMTLTVVVYCRLDSFKKNMKFSSKVVRNNLEKTSWKLQLGDMEMAYNGEFCKGYVENSWLRWKSSEYQRGLKPIN